MPFKVVVNDKSVGSISSKPLCEAFANIYKDNNAVCAMSAVGSNGEVAAAPPSSQSYAFKGAMLGFAAGLGIDINKRLMGVVHEIVAA